MRLHSLAWCRCPRLGAAAALAVAAGFVPCAAASAAAATVSAYVIPGSGAADTLAIAPAAAGGQSEWVIDTEQASPTNLTGAATLYGLPAAGGAPSVIANLDVQNSGGFANSFNGGAGVLVNDGGSDYAASINGGLIGLGAGGVTDETQVTNLGQGQLAVVGGDDFYAAEGDRAIEATIVDGANPLPADYGLPNAYASGNGGGGIAALASEGSGDALWFTTESNQLGCLNTGSHTFSDPYPTTNGAGAAVTLSGLPGTLALGGTTLYGVTAANDAIAAIDTGNPDGATVYAAPANAIINGLTVGPDGDVWFADVGNDAIGELNVAAGTISEYPLPSGVTMASFDLGNSTTIAPGPAGSGAVFFQAVAGGEAAVGVVTTGDTTQTSTAGAGSTSCPGPTASTGNGDGSATGATSSSTSTPSTGRAPTARLKPAATAHVSAKGRAALRLKCYAADCRGRLALETAETKQVKGKRRRVTVTLGQAGYSLRKGESKTLEIKLTKAGLNDVHAAKGRRLEVTAAITPRKGSRSSAQVTLSAL